MLCVPHVCAMGTAAYIVCCVLPHVCATCFQIGVKLMEWRMIIQVTVTNNFLKNLKRPFTIIKQAYQLNQRSYAFEILYRHYPFINRLVF